MSEPWSSAWRGSKSSWRALAYRGPMRLPNRGRSPGRRSPPRATRSTPDMLRPDGRTGQQSPPAASPVRPNLVALSGEPRPRNQERCCRFPHPRQVAGSQHWPVTLRAVPTAGFSARRSTAATIRERSCLEIRRNYLTALNTYGVGHAGPRPSPAPDRWDRGVGGQPQRSLLSPPDGARSRGG